MNEQEEFWAGEFGTQYADRNAGYFQPDLVYWQRILGSSKWDLTGAVKIMELGANKGKFWDQFVDMWAAKAAHHDHGMLGAYMELFAEIYDTESRPKNQ